MTSDPQPYRAAVVYLPGIGETDVDQSLDSIAAQLRAGLDQAAATPSVTFEVARRDAVSYGEDDIAPVRTLERRAGDRTTACLDVYSLSFMGGLVERLQAEPTWRQMFRLLWMLLRNLGKPISAMLRFKNRTARPGQLVQAFWAPCAFIPLAAYFLLLAAVLLSAVFGVLTDESRYIAPVVGETVAGFLAAHAGTLSAGLVIAQTAIGRLVPARIRQLVTSAAAGYLILMEYMSASVGRPRAINHLPQFLESLANQGREYDRIVVVGYSFGSIITIDSILPPGREAPRAVCAVHTFATIGCPFDVVHAYWPQHFEGRRVPSAGRPRWLNFRVKADPLSSHFGEEAPARAGVVVEDDERSVLRPDLHVPGDAWGCVTEVGFFGGMLYHGLRMHRSYWSEDPGAQSCFYPLAAEAFEGTPLLE